MNGKKIPINTRDFFLQLGENIASIGLSKESIQKMYEYEELERREDELKKYIDNEIRFCTNDRFFNILLRIRKEIEAIDISQDLLMDSIRENIKIVLIENQASNGRLKKYDTLRHIDIEKQLKRKIRTQKKQIFLHMGKVYFGPVKREMDIGGGA